MNRWNLVLASVSVAAFTATGCMPGSGLPNFGGGDSTGLVAGVVAKAENVAQQIGGPNGFGGTQMEGFRQHMGTNMGFNGTLDLADPNGQMTVRLHNDSDEECTFHLIYAASHMDLEDQMMDVTVGPGATNTVEIPCAELVGLGGLNEVGNVACELGNGQMFDNRMCVPGFMNSDFACSGAFDCFFGPDEDDADGDGDTEEMMATTQTLLDHLGQQGMMGHDHGMHMRGRP